MPRLSHSVPKYRKHRASGQAVVTIAGRDHYLGPHGTKASKAAYDRLVGEWIAAGRPVDLTRDITITELIAAYWKFAEGYYVKHGKPTGTANNLKPVLGLLRRTYGTARAIEFGPVSLKALRQKLIEMGHCRRYVNDNVQRVGRVFKWAASEELIPVGVYEALRTVDGLRKGRSAARETDKVRPVSQDVIEATILHLPRVVADMVRFQSLTGCRPGEVCSMRPCDLETSDDVWLYRPLSHKTEHHARDRAILIGPKAQDVLRPYLLRDKSAYCFSPRDSERKRLAERHQSRSTPVAQGNGPGTNRKPNPLRQSGACYTHSSYRRAVQRACDRAFPPPDDLTKKEVKDWQKRHRWSPNQLRHTFATYLRRRFGLESAQVVLGHSRADVTQIYAERDLNKATVIAREVG